MDFSELRKWWKKNLIIPQLKTETVLDEIESEWKKKINDVAKHINNKYEIIDKILKEFEIDKFIIDEYYFDIIVGIGVEYEHGKEVETTNVSNDSLITTIQIALRHLMETIYYYRLLIPFVEVYPKLIKGNHEMTIRTKGKLTCRTISFL